MRTTLLSLGVIALLATTAMAQLPAEVHHQKNRSVITSDMLGLTTPPVDVVSTNNKSESPQALTYTRLWLADGSPFFNVFTTNRVLQYDVETDRVFFPRNARIFTGGNLSGGWIRLWSARTNGTDSSSVEVLNQTGTLTSMPNLALANPGSNATADLYWSIMGFTYTDGGATWPRSSQLTVFKSASGVFDFPMEGPEENNNSGYTWNYGDAVGVNGEAASTYVVSQLSNGNGNGQFGAYGVWGFDYGLDDFTTTSIPNAWAVSQFRNPNNPNSTFNGGPRVGADAEGRLYMVVNNMFADAENDRVVAVSTSEDQGANWSAFTRMQVSALNAYASAQGWTNIFVYRPYDMEALVVTGEGQFSYFFRVASQNTQNQLENLDLVEAAFDNGSWTLNKVASLNGIPLYFTRNDSLSQALVGPNAWVSAYDVNPQGHEIEAALAADGSGIVVKWIDENPRRYQRFNQPYTAYFRSQTTGLYSPSTFDSVAATDVYVAAKPTGQGWTMPWNVTDDNHYDHATRIPAVVPSLTNVPFMSLKTITKAEYNPQFNLLPAIQAMPDIILDAQIDPSAPGFLQYARFDALNPNSVEEDVAPMNFTFNSVEPNPASDIAELTFTMDTPGFVQVEVYSSTGAKVATVSSGNRQAGIQVMNFDAANFASGSYFVSVTVNGERITKPLVIVK